MSFRIREQRCKHCKGTHFSKDLSTPAADLVCTTCGQVQEENPIVSEVTFGETSNGAAMVQGSFVGADQKRAGGSGGVGRTTLDSREQTLAKAKRRIKNVATVLKIPDYISDAAFSWFRLALTNNFVQGRKSQNVVAACLYVACRKEKTHHMLIDFSSRLQISVFSVGATFLKMVKVLNITALPLADPSLFIQHFADKLNFGKQKVKVIKDAVKLAHRMTEDWIHEGRRPAGVAGACLLLAARMNNFRRTHAELVAVAHVAEDTLQKRLNEFKQTHGAKMTVKEFREAENIEACDPPSFTKNRNKDLLKQRQLEKSERLAMNDNMIQMLLKDGSISTDEINDQLKRIEARQKQVNQELKKVLDVPINKLVKFKMPDIKTEDLLAKISSEEVNLEDVDDNEIDGFLLTAEESDLKTRIWHGLNHDFLKEQQRKKLKAEA
ncbi:hypothetical protein PACTADRAFT_47475, partial [Pachysolen tannophilus NRRL Y-2460]